MSEIDQTVERIADLDLPEKNDILYEENSNGANYDMCDHYSFCTVADLKALATAYTQLKADLATAVNEADALRAEVELARQILSGEHLEIQFDKGGYRFNYHDYDDTKAMWCAFNMRDGKYIGDPQRFYPLLELLDLHAAIKPNAAAGEEGTDGKR